MFGSVYERCCIGTTVLSRILPRLHTPVHRHRASRAPQNRRLRRRPSVHSTWSSLHTSVLRLSVPQTRRQPYPARRPLSLAPTLIDRIRDHRPFPSRSTQTLARKHHPVRLHRPDLRWRQTSRHNPRLPFQLRGTTMTSIQRVITERSLSRVLYLWLPSSSPWPWPGAD